MISSGYAPEVKPDYSLVSEHPFASMGRGCFGPFIGDVASTIPFRRFSNVSNPLRCVSHYLTERIV